MLGIHHASLLVSDTRRALAFYSGVLGLEPDPERPKMAFPGAWLQVGAQQIHLLELPDPDSESRRPEHGGRDRHVALLVDDLDVVERQLNAAGIPYSRSASGRNALFCRDPDKNALEFIPLGG